MSDSAEASETITPTTTTTTELSLSASDIATYTGNEEKKVSQLRRGSSVRRSSSARRGNTTNGTNTASGPCQIFVPAPRRKNCCKTCLRPESEHVLAADTTTTANAETAARAKVEARRERLRKLKQAKERKVAKQSDAADAAASAAAAAEKEEGEEDVSSAAAPVPVAKEGELAPAAALKDSVTLTEVVSDETTAVVMAVENNVGTVTTSAAAAAAAAATPAPASTASSAKTQRKAGESNNKTGMATSLKAIAAKENPVQYLTQTPPSSSEQQQKKKNNNNNNNNKEEEQQKQLEERLAAWSATQDYEMGTLLVTLEKAVLTQVAHFSAYAGARGSSFLKLWRQVASALTRLEATALEVARVAPQYDASPTPGNGLRALLEVSASCLRHVKAAEIECRQRRDEFFFWGADALRSRIWDYGVVMTDRLERLLILALEMVEDSSLVGGASLLLPAGSKTMERVSNMASSLDVSVFYGPRACFQYPLAVARALRTSLAVAGGQDPESLTATISSALYALGVAGYEKATASDEAGAKLCAAVGRADASFLRRVSSARADAIVAIESLPTAHARASYRAKASVIRAHGGLVRPIQFAARPLVLPLVVGKDREAGDVVVSASDGNGVGDKRVTILPQVVGSAGSLVVESGASLDEAAAVSARISEYAARFEACSDGMVLAKVASTVRQDLDAEKTTSSTATTGVTISTVAAAITAALEEGLSQLFDSHASVLKIQQQQHQHQQHQQQHQHQQHHPRPDYNAGGKSKHIGSGSGSGAFHLQRSLPRFGVVTCVLISAVRRQGQAFKSSPGLLPFDGPPSRSLLVHFHDGGYVCAPPASLNDRLLAWSASLDCPVLSVRPVLAHGGRQRPGTGAVGAYPRVSNEAFYAYAWALAHASLLGWTGERVYVAGEGCGGTLAFGVALRAIREGVRVPDAVLPVHPELQVAPRLSPSRLLGLTDPSVAGALRAASVRALSGGASIKSSHYWINPLAAPNTALKRLPPVYLVGLTLDPLLDDCVEMARRLRAAGTRTCFRVLGGAQRGFLQESGVSEAARIAAAQCLLLAQHAITNETVPSHMDMHKWIDN